MSIPRWEGSDRLPRADPPPSRSRCRLLEAGSFLSRAFAEDNISFVHKDRPQWRELTAADFAEMRRKVVIDGRGILRREAMEGVELNVPGG